MEWSNVTITSLETKYEGPPDKRVLKAVDKAGELFYDKKDYKGAIKAAKKILRHAKTDYDSFFGHFVIAMSLVRMENIDKAASEASEALEYCNNYYGSNSYIFWCHNFLAEYYDDKNMYEKAMEILEKGFRFADTNENLYVYYINMASMNDRCDDSQNEFKMAQAALQYAESDVDIAPCYLQMAHSEWNLSEFDLENHGQEAIKYSRLCLSYVEKSLSENQGNILVLRKIARLCCQMMCTIYEERGEKDKAAEQVKRALKYTDEGGEEGKEVYMSLVHYDIGKKNINALKNLRILLCYYDTKKEKFDICHQLMMKYKECADLQNAVRMAQAALKYAETDVEFADCYGKMSMLQWELEDQEREAMENARNFLDYVEKIVPNDKEGKLYWRTMKMACYTVLSYGYKKIGKKDKAIEEANHALQYTDGDRETEKELYKIIARCQEEREDGSALKSLQILLRYCDTDEERARVHDDLAVQYMEINDWDKAREEWAIAVNLNPTRELIVELLELYHIDENIQACKDLILKYGVRKDELGITDYVKNDPELKKYLK